MGSVWMSNSSWQLYQLFDNVFFIRVHIFFYNKHVKSCSASFQKDVESIGAVWSRDRSSLVQN